MKGDSLKLVAFWVSKFVAIVDFDCDRLDPSTLLLRRGGDESLGLLSLAVEKEF